MSFNIALIAPEIPQNTGNIIRLCANTGARLHLVEPLGFELTEKSLRRASLDYKHLANVAVHESFESLLDSVGQTRMFATTSSGTTRYDKVEYQDGDTVIFGSESRGLSDETLAKFSTEQTISVPMMSSNRSINLSNAVSIVVYEMWRQQSFLGAESPTPRSRKYFS
ncbi:tRNA (cytidine(34)-2'-O)-methyltransferase [Dehalococcoides mccartyi]|nr:tRNA (cytidine(34)-2'-O)-methyltransferase [Dehalococcoides mccartyi]